MLQLRGRQKARVGVDRAGAVVEIKRRNRLAQRQVGLEVGRDGPDIFPVAAIDVGVHALARHCMRDDVAAEVNQLRIGNCLLQDFPPENVDAHRGQVPRPMTGDVGGEGRQSFARWLLVEAHDAATGVHLEDAEAGGLVLGHGDHRHGRVGIALAVGAQHLAEVHAVELVARQDHQVARGSSPHMAQSLANRIGCPLEPVAAFFGLLGRQHGHEARREHVELVGHGDVCVEAFRVELSEHEHVPQSRVEAVADGDVDEAILAADGNRRLRAFEREGKQARPASAAQDDCQYVVHCGKIYRTN